MKIIREFRTAGDFFYCECSFLPDFDNLEECEDLQVPDIKGTDIQLRMSFLLRYPKHVSKDTISTRFACISHPNLSPVIVAQEAARFLSLIQSMLQ